MHAYFRPGIIVTIAAVVTGAAAAGAFTHVRAQEARLPAVQFGMTGITRAQTARLSLANVATPFEVSPGPCRATLSFVDARGNLLQGADGVPAKKTVTLRAGESTFLEITATSLPGDVAGITSRRVDFRPVVNFSGASIFVSPGPCVPSAEVIDTASASTVFVVPAR
jgi:hypothetical protein